MPDFDLDSALAPRTPAFPQAHLNRRLADYPRNYQVFGADVHTNPQGHTYAFAEIGRSKRSATVITVGYWNTDTETWQLM